MTPEHSKRPTILLVDDTLENLQVLISSLKEQGFRIVVAQSGEEALQRVEHTLPDLILLDVRMPGIDGFETCRRLKAHESGKDIPVIFMTMLSESVDTVKGFEVGGVDYLSKPVQPEEVVARIKTHLTIRTLQQQLQEHNTRLEEQNERFRTLSEATFEGILIHDEGRILEVNQKMINMFGYRRADMLGKHVLELVSPASRDMIAEHIRTKVEYPYEAEGIRHDGSTFPLEIQAKTMPYEGRDVRVASVRDLSWRKALEEERAHLLRGTIPDRYKFGEMIGKSPAMQAVYEMIVQAAASNTNVVICGESGTGKELVARTIHQRSVRHAGPFVAVNCGAVSASLFEREFFGHRKGAFTGADRDRPGFFDQAHKGTLFLDEVSELSPPFQVKLLRALEEKAFIPVGHTIRKTVDVRIIAATNRDLPALLRTGAIREDFFYRLSVTEITLPPLRDRREDIPLLVDHWLKHYSEGQEGYSTLPGHIIEALCTYDWPGNVRELQNELQRYLTHQRLEFVGNLDPAELLENARVGGVEFDLSGLSFKQAVETFEHHLLAQALAQHAGRQDKTAAMWQIPPKTLYRKIHKYKLKHDKE